VVFQEAQISPVCVVYVRAKVGLWLFVWVCDCLFEFVVVLFGFGAVCFGLSL